MKKLFPNKLISEKLYSSLIPIRFSKAKVSGSKRIFYDTYHVLKNHPKEYTKQEDSVVN